MYKEFISTYLHDKKNHPHPPAASAFAGLKDLTVPGGVWKFVSSEGVSTTTTLQQGFCFKEKNVFKREKLGAKSFFGHFFLPNILFQQKTSPKTGLWTAWHPVDVKVCTYDLCNFGILHFLTLGDLFIKVPVRWTFDLRPSWQNHSLNKMLRMRQPKSCVWGFVLFCCDFAGCCDISNHVIFVALYPNLPHHHHWFEG